MQFTLTIHPAEISQATRAALLQVAAALLHGEELFMTKAELEAALDTIQATLGDVKTAITGSISAAATGLAADIADLKAQIDAGATGDISAKVQAILDSATALKTSTADVAGKLTALDAETTQAGEGTGGTGTEPGGGTTGTETGGGDTGTETPTP